MKSRERTEEEQRKVLMSGGRTRICELQPEQLYLILFNVRTSAGFTSHCHERMSGGGPSAWARCEVTSCHQTSPD
ncbi:uncharacterized protein V6R79_001164 [Siganus canaliculatus]